MPENIPLKDSELTPEQLKKREKNRRRKAAKKAKAQQETKIVQQPKNEKPAPENRKQTREERMAERYNRKASKLENYAEDAVVVVAESMESRAIAFPLDEINRITENIRNNMGSDRISFETGIDLLTKFRERVMDNITSFIELAHDNEIGSKYLIDRDADEKKKRAKRIERSMKFETPEEAKEREALDKALEKAKETVEKQYEMLQKVKETYKKALEDVDTATEKRIEAGEQRAREAKEAEKAKKEAEKAAETAKEQQTQK